jgi:hypothetical protein
MITGQVTPAVDLEDELPERQAAPGVGQGSDGGIEGGDRRSLFTLSDAYPAHYVRIFDVIDANFRIKRQVMNVGHVRSQDVVRVRSAHVYRLPRPVPTIKPVGTIASVENYKEVLQPCGYARKLTARAVTSCKHSM